MKQLAATALLALLALIAVSAGDAAAGPSLPTVLQGAGTWSFSGLPSIARANVAADVAQATPAARRLLGLLDGQVAIDHETARCAPAEACSYGEPSQGRPWTIHVGGAALEGTYPSQRFLVLHELGHAVWGMVLRPADRAAFSAAVARSLAGAPCTRARSGEPCASTGEMFADEFARWAGGFAHSMTVYETPALLASTTFGDIVAAGLATRV